MRQSRRGAGFLRGGAPLFILLIGGSVGLAAIIQQKIDAKVNVWACNDLCQGCRLALDLQAKEMLADGADVCRTATKRRLN